MWMYLDAEQQSRHYLFYSHFVPDVYYTNVWSGRLVSAAVVDDVDVLHDWALVPKNKVLLAPSFFLGRLPHLPRRRARAGWHATHTQHSLRLFPPTRRPPASPWSGAP